MNKLISAAGYFISLAEAQKATVNELGMAKLELAESDQEFQELFNRRQELRAIITGLSHLQWQLGMTKDTKSVGKSAAHKMAVPLQKELAQLAFEVEDAALRDHIVAAREFVKLETASRRDAGLSIFDMVEPTETKVDMSAIDGDGGLFDHSKPSHAPEYAPTS